MDTPSRGEPPGCSGATRPRPADIGVKVLWGNEQGPGDAAMTGTHRAVRPAPDLLAALLEGSGEGIVVCDADGVVTLANAAAVRLVPGVEPGLPAPAPLDSVPPAPEGRIVTHGGRAIRIRTEAVGACRLAWYLTDLNAAPRTEFLLEAGRRLSAS